MSCWLCKNSNDDAADADDDERERNETRKKYTAWLQFLYTRTHTLRYTHEKLFLWKPQRERERKNVIE